MKRIQSFRLESKPQGIKATGKTEQLPDGALCSEWHSETQEFMNILRPDGTSAWFRIEEMPHEQSAADHVAGKLRLS